MEQMRNSRLHVAMQRSFVASDLSLKKRTNLPVSSQNFFGKVVVPNNSQKQDFFY
jgi:hypothetical protein